MPQNSVINTNDIATQSLIILDSKKYFSLIQDL